MELASKPATPTDPDEPLPYDRTAFLKMAFFDIFADHTTDPPQLDYVDMVCVYGDQSIDIKHLCVV